MKIKSAPAKINLTLDVVKSRSDGYHELSSVMQAISLSDTLIIKKSESSGIKLKCDNPALPADEGNLVYRIASYLLAEYDIRQGIDIELYKKIPIAAGLAGGSTDCAAALLGINELLELGIPSGRLYEIGRIHGADVPFCLMGGTALAEGIGEKLTPLPDHPKVWIVLARLPVLVSTKEIFSRCKPSASNLKSPAMAEAIISGDIQKIAAALGNSLTNTAAEMHPQIAVLATALKEQGAIGVNMSGSGPTVFAYFFTEAEALRAVQVIKEECRHEEVYRSGPKPDFYISLCCNRS